MTPPGTAGVYTLIERRWRCAQHYLFSCKASPRDCPDPTDLWADLGTSCRLRHRLARTCTWRFMWTPLMKIRFARIACPGCWILSPSCRAVPAPGVMLCAHLLLPLFSGLGLLWRTTWCLQVRGCSLLGSCVALFLLSRRRLRRVLLGVAPSRSAPLGVLRPKPCWGRSPIWFFFCWQHTLSQSYSFILDF
jgi:hypothetical protein